MTTAAIYTTLHIANTRSGSVVHTRTGPRLTACGRTFSVGPRHVGDAYYWSTAAPVTCRRCLKVGGAS